MSILLPVFYLPPTLWFSQFLNDENDIILEKFENFPKQTYRNRANIYGANGKLSLIVPVKHTGNRTYRETEISYAENWQKLHEKSVKTAYQSSPYFEYYEDRLMKIFQVKEKFLFDYNLHALDVILDILKVSKDLKFTSSFEKTPLTEDYRNSFSAKEPIAVELPEYYQVFGDRMGFLTNLSIIDLLCNKGPESMTYINSIK